MKEIKVGKVIIESLLSLAVSGIAGIFAAKLKEKKKQDDLEGTLVADLTVAELRKILQQEMEA